MWVWAWVGVWRRLHLLVVSTLAGGRLSCPAPQVQNCSRSARNSGETRRGLARGWAAVRARSTPAAAPARWFAAHWELGQPPPTRRPPVGNGSRGRSWTRLTTQQAFNALMIAYVPLGSVTWLVNPWVARREVEALCWGREGQWLGWWWGGGGDNGS